ncbi:MAG: hypothetical protein IPN87_01005 [Saprospiraceae bacterium]|nr:hypothetical protein [Candidatus Brachybacter algidus]
MTIEERRRRRFSEEFRKEIVFKIESGAISVKGGYYLSKENVKTGRMWPLCDSYSKTCRNQSGFGTRKGGQKA